ncbi:cyclic nucleotide-binding protein [Mucilaginibacter sp. PPCGB 2223]|uniref:Crp/Fnr family transcriptional regulator n=1 Tax=Mucilaginibacter sp. PPCGB 2223 TaxID=1886027 RepID=UPI000824EF0C|nr:cyclic nucleotide-binding domain-containing protein [Mucilaginibacter sp. PPCGB 2223]OCX52286.1 cyclic nucleotide-binding protein [Mucilaginibacter sp. PPCGB 2223]
MITAFENYLRQETSLSDADIHQISSLAIRRKLRRNEFLFREGEVCRHKVFVISGLLRIFGMTPDGGEHILQFSPETTWTIDAESYDRQTPSIYNIDAVEPSELLLWTKADFDSLLTRIPQLKKFAEQLISGNTYSGRRRLLTALSATPEQKYEDFVQTFPRLLSRLPLRMIAGYLGISLKTLNRVRQAQLLRS